MGVNFQNENNCILSLIQTVLVLKLQVVSAVTNKWVVSLFEKIETWVNHSRNTGREQAKQRSSTVEK